MEINSTNSMSNKSAVSPQESSPEESSWTMYFEEYFAHKNDHNGQLHPLSFGCDVDAASSAVSDAASSAAKELPPVSARSRKRLGFKKRNKISYSIGGFMVDDDLQDTASSPKQQERAGSRRGGRKGKREIGSQKKGFCLVPLPLAVKYLP